MKKKRQSKTVENNSNTPVKEFKYVKKEDRPVTINEWLSGYGIKL